MIKWDFTVVGASLLKTATATSGDSGNIRTETFMSPSFNLVNTQITISEGGQYKTAVTLSQINEIDGVVPTDLDDALSKLVTLVENFNGGGGTPQLTADELDAVQGANSPSASNVFLTENDLPSPQLTANELEGIQLATNPLQASNPAYTQADALAKVDKGVIDITTSALSRSDLNTAYPNVTTGFKVYCPDISGGGFIYECIVGGDTWVSYPITTVA